MGNMKKETEDRTPEAKRSEVPIHRNGANLIPRIAKQEKGKKEKIQRIGHWEIRQINDGIIRQFDVASLRNPELSTLNNQHSTLNLKNAFISYYYISYASIAAFFAGL